jgi:hypothetical protein
MSIPVLNVSTQKYLFPEQAKRHLAQIHQYGGNFGFVKAFIADDGLTVVSMDADQVTTQMLDHMFAEEANQTDGARMMKGQAPRRVSNNGFDAPLYIDKGSLDVEGY